MRPADVGPRKPFVPDLASDHIGDRPPLRTSPEPTTKANDLVKALEDLDARLVWPGMVGSAWARANLRPILQLAKQLDTD